MNRLTRIAVFAVFLFVTVTSKSQSLELYGGLSTHYFGQFGGKIGLAVPLKSWDTSNGSSSLKIRPELGFVGSPGTESNLSIGIASGIQLTQSDQAFYFYPSVQLSYLNVNRQIDGTVNLGTGEVNKVSETSGSFLSGLNGRLGWTKSGPLGFFLEPSVGYKWNHSYENELFFGLDTGVTYRLNSK